MKFWLAMVVVVGFLFPQGKKLPAKSLIAHIFLVAAEYVPLLSLSVPHHEPVLMFSTVARLSEAVALRTPL